MSYLSSPLWLMLVVLFLVDTVRLRHVASVTYIGRYPVLAWPVSHALAFLGIAAATIALLYGPKLLSVAVMLRDTQAVQRCGGFRAITISVLAETVLSTMLAPILMLSHTWFVANALIGRSIGWSTQQRDCSGIGFRAAAVAFAPHTIIGVTAGLLTWYYLPETFWWEMPLLAGAMIAIVLCWLTSNAAWGEAARRRGIFLVASEVAGLPILNQFDRMLGIADDGDQGMNRENAETSPSLQTG